MTIEEQGRDAAEEMIRDFDRIRRFSGPPAEFWQAFLEESARLAGARVAILLLKPEAGAPWGRMALWPAESRNDAKVAGPNPRIDEAADAAARDGFAVAVPDGKAARTEGALVAVRLKLQEERLSVAVYLLAPAAALAPREAAARLVLVADAPAVYQLGQAALRARSDVAKFAEALDLMVLLNAQTRFMAAAMTFCNEIASRYRCDRVSLGWLKGAYVRLRAISHMEKFEKKTDVVQSLEAAMEEAFDQDEEILWPPGEGSHAVVRDHERFSREQGSRHIVSLTIRLDDKPEAVLTCERSAAPFSEEEVRGLRVLADQSARRLGDLQRRDRWFGARAAAGLREGLARFLGPEHTFAKAAGIVVFVALAFLIFGKLDYRVEAPFVLKTDDLAYVPAPFDGYIREVNVKIGDPVKKGAPLLSLDTRELAIEESTAIANQNRYRREAEKALAQKALADMKVARALEDQARAQLDLVRYHAEHADIRAPFDGIVVEGEMKELLGAPVKKGDVLFKVARIEKMYAELKVNERDVHEVKAGAKGEIAFVTRPDMKFPLAVERIDPVAVTEEGENVFLVRVLFPEGVSPWWRPGMSGVAKIEAGRRNVLWIFTHRTVDFLRIFLWW
jgi:RND family efflux transporter MFP subunit